MTATESNPTLSADLARYRELTALLSDVPPELAPLKFQALWAELEQIKNRHGGMPPVESARFLIIRGTAKR